MSLLYPYLNETLTSKVVSRKRPRNMSQTAFYRSQLGLDSVGPSAEKQVNPEKDFYRAPETANYVANQIERYKGRPAIPELLPGARVRNPDMNLVAPSSFQKYYEQLATINRQAQEMLAAEQARSAGRRANPASTGLSGGSQRATGGSQNFGTGIPSAPAANFRFAQNIAPQYGWGANELSAWYTLGMKESGWRNTAQNPTSTAYGIGQFLNSTWGTVGGVKTSDPRTQVDYMAKYIKQRYGSPSRALAFHLSHNWY